MEHVEYKSKTFEIICREDKYRTSRFTERWYWIRGGKLGGRTIRNMSKHLPYSKPGLAALCEYIEKHHELPEIGSRQKTWTDDDLRCLCDHSINGSISGFQPEGPGSSPGGRSKLAV